MTCAVLPTVFHSVAPSLGTASTESERRAEAWAAELGPLGRRERWLVARAAVASAELERIERDEHEERAALAQRAAAVWDLDREVEVEGLAAKLKNAPARISRLLQTTKHGAIWLADRWRALGRTLDAGRDWTEAQRASALDLLGVPSTEREGITPADPPQDSTFDRMTERKITAANEIDRLLRVIDGPLTMLDAEERRRAAQGVGMSPRLDALRKQKTAAARHLKWAFDTLEKARKTHAKFDAPKPDDRDDDTENESLESECRQAPTCRIRREDPTPARSTKNEPSLDPDDSKPGRSRQRSRARRNVTTLRDPG